MEESGSEGLDEALRSRKGGWLGDVDYVCISDNYWLGKNKPCITYGLRGVCYYHVEVTSVKQDLHSGVFGGSVHEAMTDLVHIMNNLVGVDGKIMVKGINEHVAPVTEKEMLSYKSIDFSLDDYAGDIGAPKLVHQTKEDILMHRWRFPSLSLHGIEGAFSEPGSKTVIPCKVIGKFSIRIVPNQTPEEINAKVKAYVEEVHKSRGSPNTVRVVSHHGGMPWVADVNHPHYQAGIRAVKTVFGVEPDLTREGGSIPVTLTLQECTGKNVTFT